MSAPAWLTARPIAHRGLHARDTGIVENTLSAAQAAIERGFSIECDVQLSADGEAVVFHDSTLERLTASRGSIAKKTVADLAALALKGTDDRIATLPNPDGTTWKLRNLLQSPLEGQKGNTEFIAWLDR